jgi:hypothetical protein
MRESRAQTCCLVAAALLALSAPAAGAAVVPPGNSAANQYTEAFPTAGGQATPGKTIRGQAGGGSTQALSGEEARQLEAAGPAGRALAEVVAETAPAGVAPSGSAATGGGDSGGAPGGANRAEQSQPEGSSAFREVLGQAAGSSGDTGLLLPILVLATVIAAAAYWMRNRSRTTPPPKPL